MVRKKVKLAYIENNSARRRTYRKRVKGLVKMTRELSVLSGVDACAIIYGPESQVPVVWPPSKVEATRIISNFKRMSEVEQSLQMFNHHTFLKESVKKAEEKVLKVQRRNREIQIENLATNILSGKSTLQELTPIDLADVIWVLDYRMMAVQQRINVLEEGGNNKNLPPNPNTINNGSHA